MPDLPRPKPRLPPPRPKGVAPPPPPSMPDLVVGADFNGPDYDPEADHARLTGQILRVFDLMRDSRWRTLDEIERRTGDPQASISAQLRHLRKKKFGCYVVEKRRRGDEKVGLFEYRLLPPLPKDPTLPLEAS